MFIVYILHKTNFLLTFSNFGERVEEFNFFLLKPPALENHVIPIPKRQY